MASEMDPSFWKTLLDWVWAPLGAVIGAVWNMLHKRIDKVEALVEKVDASHQSEMSRQRDNIAKLFEKLEEARKEFRDDLAEHATNSERRHIEILNALHGGLARKVDR